MHSAGLELTKLTYTRLEDNLIRHRGDVLLLLGYTYVTYIPGTFQACLHYFIFTLILSFIIVYIRLKTRV